MTRLVCLLPIVALLASACESAKTATTPLEPTPVTTAEPPAPEQPRTQYPTSGPEVLAYVAAKYPEKFVGGISREERLRNMEFIRDRVIEVGKCGGLTLGWNLKRGGPEVSIDFITERMAEGHVIGHDIAFDYDNTSRPLQLYWGAGDHPFYKEYPDVACE
jgi:hypothetical protein